MSASRTAMTVVLVSIAWVYIPQLLSPKLKPVWGGFTHKDFKHVEEIFRVAIEDGRLKGGSVSAYYKGEVIVDLWGGYADVEAQRPWREDTVTLFYSTTKLIGAIVLATMVDKGLLDYKKPVAHYWPEFGQNGKDKITVEMLLSHQAGLAVLDTKISLFDIRDKQQEVEKLLARQIPEYEPGYKFGYHSVSFGLYVDTLARKVDPKHRNISKIFQEDIAEPFGIDFHIGLPKRLHYRSARIYPMSIPQLIWNAVITGNIQTLRIIYLSLPITGSTWYRGRSQIKDLKNSNGVNDPEAASIGFTSFTGRGPARALAKLFSILATGGSYEGRKLLSPSVITHLGTPAVEGIDETVFESSVYGPGTFLKTNPKGQTIFGHPGFGGQVAFADPNTGVSFCYCTNHHSNYHLWNDPIMLQVQNAVYSGIEN